MADNLTQGERLARIETILDRIERKLDHIETEQLEDIRELAKLKNKGAGILIGVAIASAAFGASFTSMWRWLVSTIGG